MEAQAAASSSTPSSNPQGSRSRRAPKKPKPRAIDADPGNGPPAVTIAPKPKPKPKKPTPAKEAKDESVVGPLVANGPKRQGQGRRAKFGGALSTAEEAKPGSQKQKSAGSRYQIHSAFTGDDLVSSLSRELSTPPYADCVICFSSIHPAQPTWSCSPSVPISPPEGAEVQYCWNTFHLKCIRSWSQKSYNDVKEAWRARGEPERDGEWRCPVSPPFLFFSTWLNYNV